MKAHNVSYLFNWNFEKSTEEIIKAAQTKLEGLLAKIKEREVRIFKTREEYKISDAALIDVLEQARKQAQVGHTAAMSYSTSNVSSNNGKMTEEAITIGAGVVNFLLTERDFIESEKDAAKRLGLMIRNLRDNKDENGKITGHLLSYDELEYLGF